jgi:hypothetical protein
MKTLTCGGIVLLIAAAGVPAQGTGFSSDWFTIDGGGFTSVGDEFSVSGTVGQPDAGWISGGSFGLAGGFRGFVLASPAPFLSVTRTNGAIVISWSARAKAEGFVLEQTDVLVSSSPGNCWSAVPDSVCHAMGSEIRAIVSLQQHSVFFRLAKPAQTTGP